jgi:hypothetical protein
VAAVSDPAETEVMLSSLLTRIDAVNGAFEGLSMQLADIDRVLETLDARSAKLDQFVDQMREALDAMPQLPFMPKFPRSNGK